MIKEVDGIEFIYHDNIFIIFDLLCPLTMIHEVNLKYSQFNFKHLRKVIKIAIRVGCKTIMLMNPIFKKDVKYKQYIKQLREQL